MASFFDRRRSSPRSGMTTVGALVMMLGLYVFGPQETLFTNALAKLGIETFWGVLMIVSGAIHVSASLMPSHRLFNWFAHTLTSMVTAWTFFLMFSIGVSTPTINACLIIALGSLYTMIKDALEGVRMRELAYGKHN